MNFYIDPNFNKPKIVMRLDSGKKLELSASKEDLLCWYDAFHHDNYPVAQEFKHNGISFKVEKKQDHFLVSCKDGVVRIGFDKSQDLMHTLITVISFLEKRR